MRPATRLVRPQNISAGNSYSWLFRYVGVRAGRKPVRQRIFARDVRIQRIGIPSYDHLVENVPNRVPISVDGKPNSHCCDQVKRNPRAFGVPSLRGPHQRAHRLKPELQASAIPAAT